MDRPTKQKTVSGLFSEMSPLSTEILALVEAHQRVVSQKLRKLGLYRGQEMLMKVLEQNGGCAQSELASYLCLDHSTVTKSIGRMEKSGLVTHTKSSKDKRVTIVNLTESGARVLHEVDDLWRDIDQLAKVGLSDKDVAEFIRLSGMITDNLQA